MLGSYHLLVTFGPKTIRSYGPERIPPPPLTDRPNDLDRWGVFVSGVEGTPSPKLEVFDRARLVLEALCSEAMAEEAEQSRVAGEEDARNRVANASPLQADAPEAIDKVVSERSKVRTTKLPTRWFARREARHPLDPAHSHLAYGRGCGAAPVCTRDGAYSAKDGITYLAVNRLLV